MAIRIPEEARRRLEDRLARLDLPHEFVDELLDHHALVSYDKGQSLFLHGSTADVGFWILSGLVKLYSPSPDGSRVMVALFGPGDLAGVTDYLEANGRRAQAFEAEALTKATVALFTRDYVIKALQKLNPAKLVAVFEQLNTSWSSLTCSFVQFLGMSFRDRLLSVFDDLAARFAVRDARGMLFTATLSHEDFAEMIASSRPMVSRLIAEMIDQRIVARQGKHYILLNKAAARAVAEPSMKVTGSLMRPPELSPNPGMKVTETWGANGARG